MTTVLIYLVVMVLVAAVVYLIAAAVFGRGEELAPLPPGASPTRLPADQATGDDVRAVRFQQVLRGYKMSEVDWVLSRLGSEMDQLRGRIAELESHPDAPAAPGGPAPATGTPATGTPGSGAPGSGTPGNGNPGNGSTGNGSSGGPSTDGASLTTEVVPSTIIVAVDGESSGSTGPLPAPGERDG